MWDALESRASESLQRILIQKFAELKERPEAFDSRSAKALRFIFPNNRIPALVLEREHCYFWSSASALTVLGQYCIIDVVWCLTVPLNSTVQRFRPISNWRECDHRVWKSLIRRFHDLSLNTVLVNFIVSSYWLSTVQLSTDNLIEEPQIRILAYPEYVSLFSRLISRDR